MWNANTSQPTMYDEKNAIGHGVLAVAMEMKCAATMKWKMD